MRLFKQQIGSGRIRGKRFFRKPIFWIIFLLFAGLLFLFSVIAADIMHGVSFPLDSQVFRFAAGIRSAGMTNLMLFFTFLGSSEFLLPANICLIAFILWALKKRYVALQYAIISIMSLLLMYLFKGIFRRPRPGSALVETVSGFSFPSGHSLNGLVFFSLLMILLLQQANRAVWKILGIVIFPLIIVCVGFSRVYLRVHYASDVIAGFSLGIAWLILAFAFFGAIRKDQEK